MEPLISTGDTALDRGWEADDAFNVEYYSTLLSRNGVSLQAVDWGSRESQERRFAVLAAAGLFPGCSVLDVGCGTGDFFAWLTKHSLGVSYTGIDLAPAMVSVARKRFPEGSFEVRNLMHSAEADSKRFDFVVSSGIFVQRRQFAWPYFKTMVSRMFSLCARTLAFNSLSGWAGSKEDHEFYQDPLEALVFCRTLTPWVVLRHDYHPQDFTLYLHRERQT